MANTTISGLVIHDGDYRIIVENECRKDGNLTILPLYLNDADATDVFDFGGAVKIITLTGYTIKSTVAALNVWIAALESLIQGHQDTDAGAPYTFIDDLRAPSGIKVKVLEVSSHYVAGEPTRLNWTIKLVNSSTYA